VDQYFSTNKRCHSIASDICRRGRECIVFFLVVGWQGVVRVGQDVVRDVDVASVQLLCLCHSIQHAGGGIGIVIDQTDLLGVDLAKPSWKFEGRKS